MAYKKIMVGQGDLGHLWDMVDGEMTMLISVIDIFLDDLPLMMTKVGDSIQTGNAQELSLYAHKLKGSLGHFHVHALLEEAQQLQKAGDDQRMEHVGDLFHLFKVGIDQFQQALHAWVAAN